MSEETPRMEGHGLASDLWQTRRELNARSSRLRAQSRALRDAMAVNLVTMSDLVSEAGPDASGGERKT